MQGVGERSESRNVELPLRRIRRKAFRAESRGSERREERRHSEETATTKTISKYSFLSLRTTTTKGGQCGTAFAIDSCDDVGGV